MNLSNVKKTFNKANQYMSEKIGGAKGTELDPEFVQNEKKIDNYKDLFDDLLNKITEYLQPNPAYRAKLMTVNAFHKLQTKSGQKAMYPQIEGQISDIFIKYSTETEGSSFGKSLQDCGETFKELEENKFSLEDCVKQNFIDPVLQIKNQEIKEINNHRKKLQSRRLHYDGLRRSKEKGTKVNEVELEESRKKFEESTDWTSRAMINFLDAETEHINILAELIKAERDYHRVAAENLEKLYTSINSRLGEVSPKDSSERSKNRQDTKLLSWGSDNSAVESYSPQSNFVMKKGYDNNKSVPSCRALYDFRAETNEELNFVEGETIKLIQQVDENWYEGELRGKVGFFPVNFVEVLVPLRD